MLLSILAGKARILVLVEMGTEGMGISTALGFYDPPPTFVYQSNVLWLVPNVSIVRISHEERCRETSQRREVLTNRANKAQIWCFRDPRRKWRTLLRLVGSRKSVPVEWIVPNNQKCGRGELHHTQQYAPSFGHATAAYSTFLSSFSPDLSKL